MWLTLAATLAFGQDAPAQRFNGQLYRPPVDTTHTLWTEDTHAAPNGYISARSFLQYAAAPVRTRGIDGSTERLVGDVAELDLLGAYQWRNVRLGFHVPTYLVTSGAFASHAPGLGDIALDVKTTVFDRENHVLGLAILGRVTLPTASVDVPLGAESTGWEVLVAADRAIDRWLLAANLGTRGVPEAQIDDVVWNDQIFARLGAGYTITDDIGLSADLAAQTNWASARNPAGLPAELMLGGWTRVRDDLVVRGGLAGGLSTSPGAPIARAVVGLSWEPDPHPDIDFDGIVDRDDACPDKPEDLDGYLDADGCPDHSVAVRLDVRNDIGEPINAFITLDGPDARVLDIEEALATVHPGTYRVQARANGFVDYKGQLTIGESQGQVLPIQMLPSMATVRVWAVDAAGVPLDAHVQYSDRQPVAADGQPVELRSGEHAIVVRADGYRAVTMSVDVFHGQNREIPIVMEPLAAAPPTPDSDTEQASL